MSVFLDEFTWGAFGYYPQSAKTNLNEWVNEKH